MTTDQAETIALQALAFLVKEDNLLNQFFASSGLAPQDLKDHFQDPNVLGGVLDFILTDDGILLSFCNATSLSPETLVMVRRLLPGANEIID